MGRTVDYVGMFHVRREGQYVFGTNEGARVSFKVAAGIKRTFYIERRGQQYEIVKVWEVGHKFTKSDVAFAFGRVLNTSPDERLIAVAIPMDDPDIAQATANITQRILRGEWPEEGDV